MKNTTYNTIYRAKRGNRNVTCNLVSQEHQGVKHLCQMPYTLYLKNFNSGLCI